MRHNKDFYGDATDVITINHQILPLIRTNDKGCLSDLNWNKVFIVLPVVKRLRHKSL